MRIFERLRGWGLRNDNIERKLFATIAGSLLQVLEQETTAPVLAISSAKYRSYRAAMDRTSGRD